MVASLLKGYNPNLSPLFQQPNFSPPLSQQFTIPPIRTQQIGDKLGRRLLQDNLAVRPSTRPWNGGTRVGCRLTLHHLDEMVLHLRLCL